MKRWVFQYHFPQALVKHANQTVIVEASNWRAAGAKADREVSRRKGIKGLRGGDIYKRSCYPAVTLVSDEGEI